MNTIKTAQTSTTTITVEDTTRGTVIASAALGSGVIALEGYFYFAPELVNSENLVTSQRVYICPYKGTAYWVDLRTESGALLPDVAWVYKDAKVGYEHIANMIGFSRHPAMMTHLAGSL